MQKDNAKAKNRKISIFSSLDAKLEFLTNRVELTRFLVGSSRVGSSRLQNVNSKLDLTISLIFEHEKCLWEFWKFYRVWAVELNDQVLISDRRQQRRRVNLMKSRRMFRIFCFLQSVLIKAYIARIRIYINNRLLRCNESFSEQSALLVVARICRLDMILVFLNKQKNWISILDYGESLV